MNRLNSGTKINRGIYICLEGLDGTGKSTLCNKIANELIQKGYSVQLLCPTAPVNHKKKRCGFKIVNRIKQLPVFCFFKYAYRSNHASRKINWQSDVIIGDRSVITSYVCRLSESKIKNKILIMLVNLFEFEIKSPDYVIYLDATYQTLLKRLKKRYALGVAPGKHDDKENSDRMRKWYALLKENSNYIKRIKNTVWYSVNAEASENETFENTMHIILEIIENDRKSCYGNQNHARNENAN